MGFDAARCCDSGAAQLAESRAIDENSAILIVQFMSFSSDVTPVAPGGALHSGVSGEGYCTKRETSKFDNYQKRERG
jgi:hypothetical protein